ncbi:LysR family transcriptional regulator [Parasulfitobacter algicola]|uniref:LysR family transcriptional regulator n=1 Tax=Parasulfitobacter algicola TaxID=2614809 RepID=A0ABX2IT57_9RHOB|nr:LysR family transcriptional regulator [Sulfitobacter algicola]NSX53992.1 LysR family transcriptional regulator [Sulfitobacter algicola]
MTIDWRIIPSLSALRAFEAAARLESLTDAANTLNVTHAAISQHIRTLEANLETSLMIRQGRKMELTEDGRRLATALATGFGHIADEITAMKASSAAAPLKVSVTASLAEHWLMPRLGAFWTKYPDIEISLTPSPALVDLKQDGFDLALRYGRGHWPPYEAEKLVSANFIMIAHPDVANTQHKDGSWPKNTRWFIESKGKEHQKWEKVHRMMYEDHSVTVYDTIQMVLSAVRAGYGLSVQPKAILEHDLVTGQLVAIEEQADPDLNYYIVTRKGHQSKNLQTFVRWLRQSA